MTELEKRLEEALRALVEQYEAEQKQLAGQVKSLRRSVERLQKQLAGFSNDMEELGADYKALAVDYKVLASGLQADRGRLGQGLVQQLPKLQAIGKAIEADSQVIRRAAVEGGSGIPMTRSRRETR